MEARPRQKPIHQHITSKALTAVQPLFSLAAHSTQYFIQCRHSQRYNSSWRRALPLRERDMQSGVSILEFDLHKNSAIFPFFSPSTIIKYKVSHAIFLKNFETSPTIFTDDDTVTGWNNGAPHYPAPFSLETIFYSPFSFVSLFPNSHPFENKCIEKNHRENRRHLWEQWVDASFTSLMLIWKTTKLRTNRTGHKVAYQHNDDMWKWQEIKRDAQKPRGTDPKLWLVSPWTWWISARIRRIRSFWRTSRSSRNTRFTATANPPETLMHFEKRIEKLQCIMHFRRLYSVLKKPLLQL